MKRIFESQDTLRPAAPRPISCRAGALLPVWLLSTLLAWGASPARGLEIRDDLGERVRLASPARRIVALYGAFNEILAAMDLEDRIVGRTKADRVPASILTRPSIGTHMRPNVEIILGLRPDLVLQMAGRQEALTAVQQLRRQGLQVAVFHPASFADLFSVIERLGVLTAENRRADTLVSALGQRLDLVAQRLEGIPSRPSVFFEVRYPSLLAAGRGSLVDDIIARAGGTNCVAKDKKLVRMNIETLIACDPDAYVVQRGPMNPNPSPPASRPHFQVLKAVREGRVRVVDEQVYSRPGPRAVAAVEELAAFLHAERFTEREHTSSGALTQ